MGMPKNDRLLYILNLLRSRRTLNAARLAEECGVTERSIYRDIISLSEANIPIYYDNGYKLASDNFLPPLNFTFDEYSCLKLALESSPLRLTGRNAGLLKQVRAKVDAGLSPSTREKKKTAVDAAHIEINTTFSRAAEKYYTEIEKAINGQCCLRIGYQTIKHGLTDRTVEPYFIVFRGHAFYFVAWCRMRKEYRTFRIDRVTALESTGERFIRKKGIDPRDYFEASWRICGGKPVDVVIRFTGSAARVIASGMHHPRERVEAAGDDAVIYRINVAGIDEIKRWILGFGSDAEVLEPEELRTALQRIGSYLNDIYGRSSST